MGGSILERNQKKAKKKKGKKKRVKKPPQLFRAQSKPSRMKTKAQGELAEPELDLPRKAELPEHPAKLLERAQGEGRLRGCPLLRLSSGTHQGYKQLASKRGAARQGFDGG